MFESGAHLAASRVREALADRVCVIPRLRQQLVPAPLGCGRPVWVDDPGFDITRHFRHVRCPPPGDQETLLGVAAGAVTDPLPPGQPLWSATLVTGLAGNARALIVVFHHVLADGMGGLAVLASLVDGAGSPSARDFPRPKPSWRQLVQDAAVGRLQTLGSLSGVPARLRDALAELRPGVTPRAPRCSLNRPVGSRRRFSVARADLARVRTVGRTCGGTVNDVVLAAVSGALNSLLAHRGERVDDVVVSVPVSGRAEAAVTQLGNQVGVIPVKLPTSGRPLDRLGLVAEITRQHKTGTRGASAALLAPVFRVLAMLGVLRWFIERQHLVTTFVTNLRGPGTPVSFLGAVVSEVIPLNAVTGNVAVAFAAWPMSHARSGCCADRRSRLAGRVRPPGASVAATTSLTGPVVHRVRGGSVSCVAAAGSCRLPGAGLRFGARIRSCGPLLSPCSEQRRDQAGGRVGGAWGVKLAAWLRRCRSVRWAEVRAF